MYGSREESCTLSGKATSRSFADWFRTGMLLGRISNLPTVWSNCLAAWLLTGGGSWEKLVGLSAAASLLYTGGMVLNDAMDADFDRQHRRERPIPSGRIQPRAVWALSLSLLVTGWLILFAFGTAAAMVGTVLVAAIVAYDWLHKRHIIAVTLMAGCRLLLYVLVAAAARNVWHAELWLRASGLALYVLGISSLARGESGGRSLSRLWVALLFVPAAIALMSSAQSVHLWVACAACVAWVGYWAGRLICLPASNVGRTVAALLAGIALVDWVAAVPAAPGWVVGFIGLFGLALLLQRVVPAT